MAAILAWLLTLVLGAYGPLVAGLAAGLLAPRRGAFLYPAVGAWAAWAVWFAVSAATTPLFPLSKILGAIIELPSLGGLLLPLLASLLAGVVAGVAASGIRRLLPPGDMRARDSEVA